MPFTPDLSVLSFSPDLARLEEQVVIAQEIAGHFDNGFEVVMLDAPTGNGKSLIAELVRQIMGCRMLYTASDKALQRQFVESFNNSSLLMGRNNYPTLLFPERFPELSAAECDKADDDCSWCGEETTLCPYATAKRALSSAPSVTTNTAYLLAESSIPVSSCVGNFADQLLVIDEGDRLTDEFLSFAEIRITPRRKRWLGLPDVERITVPSSWVTWCMKSIPIIKTAFQRISARTPDIRQLKLRRGLKDLHDALVALLPDLTNGNWILDARKGDDAIIFKPIMVNELAGDGLFSLYKHTLLMSATIISSDELASSLGITNYTTVHMDAKIPPANRPIVVSPLIEMNHKNKDTAYPVMVAAIERIMSAHPTERGLIHTVSYHLAEAVAKIDSPRIRYYSSAETKAETITWFKETPGAVIVAPSLERGIDLPDDLLRWMVIAKLPFGNLGDKQVSARLHAKGGGIWYRVNVVRSLVQMTGRGARHEDDYCQAIVLDKSFMRVWGENKALFPAWWKAAVELKPWTVFEKELDKQRESV